MKKYLSRLLSFFLLIATFQSCKKENAAVPSKDYSLSVKDKVWWGTLTNAGETLQYYSVHFSATNLLLWSQFSDNYTGQYTVERNKLTMTFVNPSVVVTADITDDNKMTNITTNTANKVNSGELVENPKIPLEGTVWSGNLSYFPAIIQLNFLDGAKVETTFGIKTYPSGSYSRSASGGVIRFDLPTLAHPMFCVIANNGTLKGSYNLPTNAWQASKR
ncbi:MAG TPA: hypothetical protein VL307_20145 [Chitinophagaceae bacterium]|nr:hypothetical protein [Chitinophagaceae bacterium]